MSCVAILLVALQALLLQAPASEDDPMKKFDGRWEEVLVIEAAKERSGWAGVLQISGSGFDAVHGKPVNGTIALDPSASPPSIDFSYARGSPYSGTTTEGVYKFKGADILILNLGLGEKGKGQPRPHDFNANPESTLVVLKRKRE